MEKFFHPQSIAIIGASEQPGKIGNILLRNLLELRYSGKIYPINPKHNIIEGMKTYPSIIDIEQAVDMAVIAIPAPLVPGAVKECATKKIPTKTIVVISAGFSESGEQGKALEQQLVDLAKQYDLEIAGPNCLGTLNAHRNLNASFSKNNFKKGKVGLIMQSGAFTTALFDLAQGENFGFSLVATLGNKAVLDEVDFMDYFAKDKDTEIIGLYLEDIKRGQDFCQALRKVSKKKPVVILKAGNSRKAQKAMMSHTGAMAGEADVAKEAITDNGGLYFDNLTDYLNAIKVLAGFKKPRTNHVVLVTNAGGPGVIVTDSVEKKETIKLMEFSDEQKKQMKEVLPGASSVENPIDVLGDADDKRYKDVLERLEKIDSVGAVLAIVTPQAQTDVEKISQVLSDANKQADYPVFPVVIGSEAATVADAVLKPKGLANFTFASGLINALQTIYEGSVTNRQTTKFTPSSKRVKDTETWFKKAVSDKRTVFYYQEASALAQAYDIKSANSFEITDRDFLEKIETFPLVIKIDSPSLLHKNTKNAVLLNIDSTAKAIDAYNTLRSAFKTEKIIAQPQEKSGLEIIMGIKKDPRFGQVLMLGLGGILTEILGKKILWVLPSSDEEIAKKIHGSFFEAVFKKQKIEVDSLIRELIKVKNLAMEHSQINELDINPILFYPDKEPVAVDIKVII